MQTKKSFSIMTRIALGFYQVFFVLVIPFLLLRLLLKSRQAPEYRSRWLERFGYFVAPAQKKGVWIHAVSMGEVGVALPIIKALQQRDPNLPITVTSTTPTGSKRIQTSLGQNVFHVYMPFDLSFCVRAFLKRIQPQAVIIMETEIWPIVLTECYRQGIPVFLANGILSDRSFPRYQKIKFFMTDLMKAFKQIGAQSKADAKRFIQLGADPTKVLVTGNIKFDMKQDASIEEAAHSLRRQFGSDRLVLIAASTHAGEEEILLQALKKIQKQFPQVLLVLVPRHPERFQVVSDLIQKHQFPYVKRSQKQSCDAKVAVFLGDSMGELPLYYAAADLAFVGGSLVSIGGHNALEAARAKLPIIVGPYTQKCKEITQLLTDVRALEQVFKLETFETVLLKWLGNTSMRIQAGERGYQVIAQNRGAVERFMKVVDF